MNLPNMKKLFIDVFGPVIKECREDFRSIGTSIANGNSVSKACVDLKESFSRASKVENTGDRLLAFSDIKVKNGNLLSSTYKEYMPARLLLKALFMSGVIALPVALALPAGLVWIAGLFPYIPLIPHAGLAALRAHSATFKEQTALEKRLDASMEDLRKQDALSFSASADLDEVRSRFPGLKMGFEFASSNDASLPAPAAENKSTQIKERKLHL